MVPMRFSLKWLMASVAMAAISIAALVNASDAWATAIITAISVCLLAAAVIAAVGAGRSQAFAVGFVIGTLFYLLSWQAQRNQWLMLDHTDLATNRILDRFYNLVRRGAPAPTPAMSGDTITYGVGFFSGKPLGPAFIPDLDQFRKIAHWLIACHIGLASGLFARGLRSARQEHLRTTA
jgi:low affinity Fe/Cu permease